MTWLIYLNEDWNADKHGGCLRCFERKTSPINKTGSRGSGDLQIGWLKATRDEPYEIPVFLDSQHSGVGANSGMCAMYIDDPNGGGGRTYISKNFHSQPTLYVAGSELLVQSTMINDKDLAKRFKFIELPKSAVTDWLQRKEDEFQEDERTLDVEPLGGTLVLFDSVSLPHAVLPTTTRERWATSGWMHEDQQPVETHPHFNLSDNTRR